MSDKKDKSFPNTKDPNAIEIKIIKDGFGNFPGPKSKVEIEYSGM